MKILRMGLIVLGLFACFGMISIPMEEESHAFSDDGQVAFISPDGTKYVGGFKDGKMFGHGTLTWTDGTKYVGEFRDNEMFGQGTFISPNGIKYVGEFRDDKMVGYGTFTLPDGTVKAGTWREGRFVFE